jgi:hypothetical protein
MVRRDDRLLTGGSSDNGERAVGGVRRACMSCWWPARVPWSYCVTCNATWRQKKQKKEERAPPPSSTMAGGSDLALFWLIGRFIDRWHLGRGTHVTTPFPLSSHFPFPPAHPPHPPSPAVPPSPVARIPRARYQNPILDTRTSLLPHLPRASQRWVNLGECDDPHGRIRSIQIHAPRILFRPALLTDDHLRHRQELVAWLNSLLQLNITKVEQCGTG